MIRHRPVDTFSLGHSQYQHVEDQLFERDPLDSRFRFERPVQFVGDLIIELSHTPHCSERSELRQVTLLRVK